MDSESSSCHYGKTLRASIERDEEPMLPENEARWDRIVRIVLGIAMLLLGWTEIVSGAPGVALKLFGWVPLITGLVGWDPFYSLLDYSTKRSHPRHP